jgi:hypothetical protein
VRAVGTNESLYVPKSTDNDVENYRLRGLISACLVRLSQLSSCPHTNVTRMSELRCILDRKKERKKRITDESFPPDFTFIHRISGDCGRERLLSVLILLPLSHEIVIPDLSPHLEQYDAFQRLASFRIKPIAFIPPRS